MRYKWSRSLLLGCAGSFALVCGFVLFMGALSDFPGSASISTLDANGISTAVFETALAISLETMTFSSPTLEVPTEIHSEDTLTPVSILVETSASVTGASCVPNNPVQSGKVVQVVDGDTIKVLLDQDGKTYSVRYIGMDTPENTSQVEYFGAEATAKNTEFVYGKQVVLIRDVSETDRYGRLLRYVLTEDVFVNYELVAQGYANTASYPPDISCIPAFQAAEQKASGSKLGLWAAPPTLALLPTSASSGDGGNAPCNCSGPDLDCGNFNSHASAQACFNYCRSAGYGDVFRLDRDNDGSACEAN